MIVVSGATGTIGSDLIRALSARGVEARALSRDPARGEDLPGIAWARADLADRGSLGPALEGAKTLFLLTGNTGDMVRLQKNAIRAAAEAGVSRVVKLSALGATDHSKSVIGLWHWVAERALRESGLAWTVLRPHHFTQNLLDQRASIVEEGVVRSPAGEGRIPFIDTRDIAAVAAEVLLGRGHEGETYTLTGPEAISYREATRILSGVLGRELAYVPESDDDAWARMRAEGKPTWLVAAQLAIAGYQRAGGPTERVTDDVERILGRPATDVETFARDHAERFAVAGGADG